MKVSVLVSKGKFETKEVSMPVISEAEVLVKVMRTGICGSDLHMYHKDPSGEDMIPGHEFAGVIEDAGGYGEFKKGDRVTALPVNNCGTCYACTHGLEQCCNTNFAMGLGFAPSNPGAYAEYIAVRADKLVKLPDDVSFSEAALIEPVGVSFRSVRLAGVKAGDRVLVTGGGIIGSACARFAKMQGASFVALTEINLPKGNAAVERGDADAAFDANDKELLPKLIGANMGNAYDVTFECSGDGMALNTCIMTTKTAGTVMVVGIGTPPPSLALSSLKELNLKGSMEYTREEFELVLAMIQSKQLSVANWMSREIGLDEVDDAFQALSSRQTLDVKIVINPER